MNKFFGLLALYAPDDVYKQIKDALLNKTVFGKDAKPFIYYALRKSIFGNNTKIRIEDLVDHLNVTHIPESTNKSLMNLLKNTIIYSVKD